MDIIVNLPVNADGTPGPSCNRETAFNLEKLQPLWKSISLLLFSGPEQKPSETLFLQQWLAARNLSAEDAAKLPQLPGALNEAIAARDFKEAVQKVRSNAKETSDKTTIYKILFHAAMVSHRSPAHLAAMMAVVREKFEIDPMVCTLISDGVASGIADFPYKPKALPPKDREAILAIIFIVLNADSQKHVLELAACRTIMTSLELTSVKNDQIAAYTAKGIPGVLAALDPKSMTAAFVNILRMVLADKVLHAEERQIVNMVASKIPPDQVQAIYKFIGLEFGKKIEI